MSDKFYTPDNMEFMRKMLGDSMGYFVLAYPDWQERVVKAKARYDEGVRGIEQMKADLRRHCRSPAAACQGASQRTGQRHMTQVPWGAGGAVKTPERITIDVTYNGGVGRELKHYRGPARLIHRHSSVVGLDSVTVRFKPLGAREWRTMMISAKEVVNEPDEGNA